MVRARALRWALLAVVILAAPSLCSAQVRFRMKRDQPPLPIDDAAANAVIDQALKRLEAEYVFPELATKMINAIRKRQADKAYADVKTGQALAEQLTKDLQAVSNDKHLRVMCSTEKLPAPPREAGKRLEPSPQMKEEMRQRGEWLNAGYRKVERLTGNIGYLELEGFLHAEVAERPAAAAMDFLANTDALIIDLRHNGGGAPESVALLCSYFFGEKPIHINSLYSRTENKTTDYWTRTKVAGKRYLGKDVYVLIGRRTFSGAEEFAYDLQTQKRATLVGETTGGGAHPGGLVPLGDHFMMFVPTGRAINPITKTDWEGVGVKPDVAVPADKALEKAQELAIERLLKNAKGESRERIRMDIEHSQERTTPKSTAAVR